MLYLAENMKYLRAGKKMSQKSLADALGITRARYSKYEYRLAEPPVDILIRLARYYAISIDDLITQDLCLKSRSHEPDL
ncbi:helix-turn-helix transcriptional regulator [Sphingobacterium sp. UT-1RO-CII-1]|uniref:helix-turn-helix domain-containing protein n=1 Tax=Sphingobacterium sp. UT-1RO-CII-1 TaxID=2995225 RepID=UPI00227BB98A|nr:helix-turn-helix transcriptional regulator [Sphingobacterium sp. UT-1RO-CII-1]MCY4780331.1 helix-turn-helix transcriptional regulator [Sphingobacterium sp. UT-1RO-CII-1]